MESPLREVQNLVVSNAIMDIDTRECVTRENSANTCTKVKTNKKILRIPVQCPVRPIIRTPEMFVKPLKITSPDWWSTIFLVGDFIG